MKTVALNEAKDDLSRYLHIAEQEAALSTRQGKPGGVPIGFGSEDDWLDYRLEYAPQYLQCIERTRQSLRAGQGIRLEELDWETRDSAVKRPHRAAAHPQQELSRTAGNYPPPSGAGPGGGVNWSYVDPPRQLAV